MNVVLCSRVVGGIAMVVIFFVIVNHWIIENGHTNMGMYNEPKHKLIDSIYFTTTTLSSVGYGDILPTTPTGKLLVAGEQMVVMMFALGMLSLSCFKK